VTRVVVTGANGFVGRAVSRVLEARGVAVVRVSRADCDLGDPAATEVLTRCAEGADAIVHAAAHVHRPEETPNELARFREVNVGGTERVVRAAAAAGIARVVYLSTIGVHGFRGGVPTEDALLEPRSTYAATKLLGESIVTAGSADARIVRLATVYGEGDRANFARLAHAIARGRFVVPGDGSARKSVIAIDDAAELIADVATRDGRVKTMHLAAPTPITLAQACDAFASAFGERAPRHVPLPVLRLAARAGDVLRAVRLPAPLDTSTLEKLVRDSVVDTGRLAAFAPAHRFRVFEEVVKSAYAEARR